nr:MAG TPA: hypothetical protein [Caudoviricetes sp.]
MSTTETARPAPTAGRPAAPSSTTFSRDDCPTEIIPVAAPAAPAVAPVPVRRSILHAAASAPAPAHPAPFADWRDRAQTEELPAISFDAGPVRPRVSTPAKPTGSREGHRTAPTGTKGLRRRPVLRPRLARHLRAALAGLLIAAALLTGLQLYAAAGISQARQTALAERDAQEARTEQASPASPTPTEQAEQAPAPSPSWLIEGTTTGAPSPLDLPRCTTSPDTPLPCLATISPSQTRAVVLEEDASLTALVRQ